MASKYLDSNGLRHFWEGIKPKLDAKADAASTVSNVTYDTANKKLTKIIGDNVLDIVTVARLKTDLALTKSDVGLNKADNTPDLEKNVASAKTAQALIAETVTPTSANEMHNDDSHRVRAFLASGTMRTGKPPTDAHVLHFNWNSGTKDTGTRDSQLAIASGATPGLYYRTQNNGTWSDWISVYSSQDAPSPSEVGLGNVVNLQQKALHGGTALGNRTNLNMVTTLGNYYAATDTIAASLVNCPVSVMFHMYVGLANGATEGNEYQEIVRYDTGYRYYRARLGESGGWSDWAEMSPYTAGIGLALNGHEFYTTVTNTVESTKRLSNLGKNKYIVEEFATSAEDLPTPNTYIILSATGNNVRYGAQLAMNENADGVYYRRITNSTYGSWLPLTYKADGNGISLTDGKFRNIGVWSVAEGTENGKITVNTNGTSAQVAVHGLGSNAFSSVSYLPLTGGTVTGNVTLSKVGQIGYYVENTYEVNQHRAAFLAASNGNTGLYDSTNTKWIVYADKTGTVTLNGNANTATEFAAAKTVKLTGDITGEVSSKGGWTIPTTLASTSVTAGNYGPSSGLTLGFGENFSVPYFQVDSKGRITGASTRTMTLPTLAATGVTAGTYGPARDVTLAHSGTLTVPYLRIDAQGRITNAANRTLTLPPFDDTGVVAGYYGQSSDGITLSHGGTFSVPYFRVNAKGQILAAYTRTLTLPADKNTEYTAGDGLSLSNYKFTNTGVRSLLLSSGSTNGTIAYKINDGTAVDVVVKGIGTAAFKNEAYFATSGHTHNYAGSASAGGAANSVANDFIIRIGSGTTENTTQYTFNGSIAKTLDIKAGSNVKFTTASKSLTIAATDTTYTAGTGLSLSTGNQFSLASLHTNGSTSAGPSENVNGTDGTQVAIPRIVYDKYGRITGSANYYYTSRDTHHTAYLRAGASDSTGNASTTNGNTYINLVENGARRSGVRLYTSGTDMKITSDASGNVIFSTNAVRSSSISVAVSLWTSTSDSNISGTYGYQASVAITGVTASQVPDVVFRPSDALTYELAPICKSYAGGIIIYAKTKPTAAITILSARAF